MSMTWQHNIWQAFGDGAGPHPGDARRAALRGGGRASRNMRGITFGYMLHFFGFLWHLTCASSGN